ncbi:bifunctional D-glycero-beta-D-manno-heptose-7-phosphate kinase/D-glycero-beta-D-manno-heptose 1-phosphate adenylyltransferase HldE [Thorsellia anophelis]|uniref:Bifunctional protein HldE n=1 Tax=Thorsellia anophelis DSM 18579 TaxID=1123402 RepID=A0A1H9Y2V7_9GAMM|nr:bifunctional D-glycero-beta-D-manno-heptose-7-phosphate kinase/D-glycero-beta-D-manno-heptose 1-phosphate adenylyltransferase HldE [Thorsellia anophelis]SES63045.1 D-beta-D-heptose 7-phosphate kinase / D-beta-D-heptose 1-phosphate adenosyltransferase [Thorsellia anophelis DSM 18579]
MRTQLPTFESASVLVVGDIMLDRYWSGPTGRISPEAPVPIVKVNHIEERPGGAANVAMNVASLGAKAQLIGLSGIDEAANSLETQLNQHKITCHFIKVASHPTITKLRILSRNQQLMRLDFEEGFDDIEPTPMIEKLLIELRAANVLVFSDYGKGVLNHIQLMIQQAKSQGKPIIIDPKGTDFKKYAGATLLTPNMSEFEAVVGKCNTEEEIETKGLELIKSCQLEALLITRSEKGMTLLQPNKPTFHLPTLAQEVYDVTGAGDTVIAVLASSLATGKSLEEACILANTGAGIVVGKLGTSTVSAIELENALRKRASIGFGIMSELNLTAAIKLARARGEKIVMTNGCFDILHAGHVSYLANARKLGSRLIVAVNSDASVARLKGPTRPINPLEQRMQVLAALESVDWVVPFEEDTPQRVIGEILPDLLVKGGDYKPDEIAGGKEVLAAGGEVRVLNFEPGISTSQIIAKAKNR